MEFVKFVSAMTPQFKEAIMPYINDAGYVLLPTATGFKIYQLIEG